MESIGIVRKTDRLGRIALPKSLRRRFKIEKGDFLEITIDGNSIILSKCRPRCEFCGGTDCATKHKGKYICQKCLSPSKVESTDSEPHTVEQQVINILKRIGIPAKLKGYYYVREAILLVIENDDFLKAVTIKLYPLIAEKHHTTVGRVERGIRYYIGVACSRDNTPFINRLFGPGKAEQGITNKEFFGTIADLLKNGYLDALIYDTADRWHVEE